MKIQSFTRPQAVPNLHEFVLLLNTEEDTLTNVVNLKVSGPCWLPQVKGNRWSHFSKYLQYYMFGMAWVNDDRFLMFGLTIPLSVFRDLASTVHLTSWQSISTSHHESFVLVNNLFKTHKNALWCIKLTYSIQKTHANKLCYMCEVAETWWNVVAQSRSARLLKRPSIRRLTLARVQSKGNLGMTQINATTISTHIK